MGHVAGTKSPQNWFCTNIKVSAHTRGHVAATYPWDMNPQHFHVCTNVLILSPAVTRSKCMSPQSVLHSFLSLQYVAITCPCNMTPRVCLLSKRRKFDFFKGVLGFFPSIPESPSITRVTQMISLAFSYQLFTSFL